MTATYQDLLKKLKKTYAPDGASPGGIRALDKDPIVVEAISTGSLQIDRFTGIGGFPRGYISELFGLPAAGKTTLAYSAIREAQRLGYRAAYIDAEFAFNPRWAVQQGVDISEDKLIFAQPEIGEVALDLAEEIIRNAQDHGIAVVVLDSVGALIPRRELAAESVGDQFMGGKALMMAKACNRLKGIVSEAGVAMIFVNHLKEKVGMTFGDPRYRPGGKALDYAASLMLEIRKGEKIEVGQEVVATTIKVAGYKNKFASFTKAEVPEVRVYVHGGVSRAYELLQVGVDTGVIKKAGAWFKYNDRNIGQGENAAERTLADDPALYAEVETAINAVAE